MSSIVVDSDSPETETTPTAPRGQALVSWVMGKVDPWRTHRDTSHKSKWDEYYRLWRAEYAESDKTRKSERAKIVAPAVMQAVDSTVAEIEEAVFGREQWVDISQDVVERAEPERRQFILQLRDRLLERMDQAKIPAASAQAFLVAAVYGTAVGKVHVEVVKTRSTVDGKPQETEAIEVGLQSLEPYEFIPDPTTNDIDEMLGMAHETIVPLHRIRQGQREGRYFDDAAISSWEGESPGDSKDGGASMKLPQGLSVYITEYHGLVPARLLYKAGGMANDPVLESMVEDPEYADEDNLVEAIVTIGNKGILLGAKQNPFWNEDRSFISYQHDTVPAYFWGRGVGEKGYQPQKALDAELRARLDALALVAHPMVAGDITRLPRGMNLGVWPGKFWPTTGNPSDVLQAFTFGNLNPATFTNAQDMERMVQMATGAMDPSSAFSANAGATQNALHAAQFIKRARRTMQNIERNWLQPLVRKVMLRYMQFDRRNFPEDPGFKVHGSLGAMAREFEQQQMIQMLSIVPNESPPFQILLKAIFDNSSSPHKTEMVRSIDQMLQPPSEEAKAEQERQKAMADRIQMAAVAEQEAKAQKAQAEAARALAQAKKFEVEADLADDGVMNAQIDSAINLREVEAFEMQNQISMMMQQLRAFDLALKAQEAQARTAKLNAEAKAIQTGTQVPLTGG